MSAKIGGSGSLAGEVPDPSEVRYRRAQRFGLDITWQMIARHPGVQDEAHLPALADSSSAYPWLSGADEFPVGSGRAPPPSGQRPQAFGRYDPEQEALTSRQHAFPPTHRLLKSDEFQRVRRGRCRVRTPTLMVGYLANSVGHLRLGLVVSRKVGNAVVRNRVKRKLREAFRHLSVDTASLDLVVIARPRAVRREFHELASELHSAVRRIQSVS
jgi:ribonuclease P protein component